VNYPFKEEGLPCSMMAALLMHSFQHLVYISMLQHQLIQYRNKLSVKRVASNTSTDIPYHSK